MANSLTSLAPELYAALDVISREMVGLIPAVSRDSSLERAALNQTVRSFVTPAASSSDIVPGQLPADDGDQTIGNKSIAITNSKYVSVRWSGEEQKSIDTGAGYNPILRDQFVQAMRVHVNEIEAALAALYAKASNAKAPAGATLFDAANYKDLANVNLMLDDNGAPISDRQLVLANAAKAAFLGNAQFVGHNTSGADNMLRQGVILDHLGMEVRASAQIKSHTAGTAASATTDNAGYAVGARVITLAAAGTGTILAGDIVSFATDGSGAKYVVEVGDADVSNGGTITLAAPGLKGALSAATKAITVEPSAQRNMAFSRNAIHLVTRAPARPMEGDLAVDVMLIQDPRSGLAFEVSMYKEYRRVRYEIAIAYGMEVIKPEHLVLLVD